MVSHDQLPHARHSLYLNGGFPSSFVLTSGQGHFPVGLQNNGGVLQAQEFCSLNTGPDASSAVLLDGDGC